MSVRAVIRKRISIRHYKPTPVPEEVLQAVVDSGENSVALDDDIGVRFQLITEGRLVAERMASICREHGPDALAFLSSAKCTNEENYLIQKLARQVVGTNNVDHCAHL